MRSGIDENFSVRPRCPKKIFWSRVEAIPGGKGGHSGHNLTYLLFLKRKSSGHLNPASGHSVATGGHTQMDVQFGLNRNPAIHKVPIDQSRRPTVLVSLHHDHHPRP
ncbi:hypothetical protein MTBSS4_120096 [Magnetospirillum sp. SS-4]|nr:hypothetical protein MTBSS4_120096 [Magnetospirillum sp. SS-4]